MNMENEKSNEHNEKIECVLNENDFNLYGDARNGVVDENCDYNLVKRNTKKDIFFQTFSIGDDITTERGISIGSSLDDVFEKYGKEEILSFDKNNDSLLQMTLALHYIKEQNVIAETEEDKLGDFKNFKGNERFIEYDYVEEKNRIINLMRFYIDINDKVILIGYFNIDCNPKLPTKATDYYMVYDFQYKILPQFFFLNPKSFIEMLNEHSILELLETSYINSFLICQYNEDDFEKSSKLIYVDNDTFSIFKIKFNIEMQKVLSKSVYFVYDNEYKNCRYFTAEYDEYIDEDCIEFCEVHKNGRENYGIYQYDDKVIESLITNIYTDNMETISYVTKRPSKKEKKEINVNDEPWLGIRVDAVIDLKKIEPSSKIDKIEGFLILFLEHGSPFKELNLDFNTANFLTEFDGNKITDLESFSKLLRQYKPGDKVKIKILSYDNSIDDFLSKEYVITVNSKNDKTYKETIDIETCTQKMQNYLKVLMQDK